MKIYNGFTKKQFWTIVKTELIKEPKYQQELNSTLKMFMETGVEDGDYDEAEAKFLAFGNTANSIIKEKIFGLNPYGDEEPLGFNNMHGIFIFETYPNEELHYVFARIQNDLDFDL